MKTKKEALELLRSLARDEVYYQSDTDEAYWKKIKEVDLAIEILKREILLGGQKMVEKLKKQEEERKYKSGGL